MNYQSNLSTILDLILVGCRILYIHIPLYSGPCSPILKSNYLSFKADLEFSKSHSIPIVIEKSLAQTKRTSGKYQCKFSNNYQALPQQVGISYSGHLVIMFFFLT